MRILVSGFEAFGGETRNPTRELINELKIGRIKVPVGVIAGAVLLPVAFQSAFEILRTEIETFKPQIVLCLGQASGRANVDVERLAVNLIDAEIPDNLGAQPREQAIDPGAITAYFSTLPAALLVEALNGFQIPARISNSAGLYVCNFLFYRLQGYAQGPNAKIEMSGFVHLPLLPEQAATKSNVPSMSFETMKRALEVMLSTLAIVPNV